MVNEQEESPEKPPTFRKIDTEGVIAPCNAIKYTQGFNLDEEIDPKTNPDFSDDDESGNPVVKKDLK